MNRDRSDVRPVRLAGDGGVALPFIAVMMLVLLAFVAFAVDVGAAFAVRRQSQSAADSAVLGAAQQILDGGSRASAASYAKVLSHSTVALDPSADDWEAAFASCSDSSALAATAPGGGLSGVWAGTGATGCVSFSGSNQRVRVKIPSQAVDAAFAALVGVETFNVSTSAEAIINFTAAGGGALPYGITGANANLDEVCLDNGGGNVVGDLCRGGTTGNFGALDFSIYGNQSATAYLPGGPTTISLATGCSNTSTPYGANDRLALNDIIGVDHPLSVVPPPGTTPIRNDRTLCTATTPPNFLARPNDVATQTGNAVISGTTNGLINGTRLGSLVLRGRFDRYCDPNGVAGWTCTNLYNNGTNERGTVGSPIDDTPLWTFLTPDLVAGPPGTSPRADGTSRAVPASCLPSVFASNPNKVKLATCLHDYNNPPPGYGPYDTVLFGKDTDGDALNGIWDIMRAPRFGFVPLLWNNTWPTGQSATVQIKEFRPVYFQTMYLGCNGGNGCSEQNPGEAWNPINSNKALDAISAMSLRLPMLPLEARDSAPAAKADLRITLVR